MNIFVYSIAHTTHMRNTCTNYFHALTHIYHNIAYILTIKNTNIQRVSTFETLRNWNDKLHDSISSKLAVQYPSIGSISVNIYTVNILFILQLLQFYNFVYICAVGIGIYSIRFHKIIFLILYNSTLHAHIGKEINLLF